MLQVHRMSSVVRRTLFRLCTAIGVPYGRLTSAADIHAFFRRLWPVDCGLPLERCGEYVVPGGLPPFEVVFSPGVGPTSSFELPFAEQGIPCHLADASVDGPAVDHPLFRFSKKFVGARTEGDWISLDDWVGAAWPSGDRGLLQMDIEGAEFEAILAADRATLRRFAMIVIEVHKLNMLVSQEGFALASLFVDRLLADFDVCHLHVNNYIRPLAHGGLSFPSDIELTLVRKDLSRRGAPVARLPHPLDQPATRRKPDPDLHPRFEAGVLM